MNKTEINGQRLVSEISYPYRQSPPQQKGGGIRDPDADVKTPGPLIDVSRTSMRVIVKMQIGIPPNISPVLGGFPSRPPFTIPKTIAED